MASLPLHPRLAHLLLLGEASGLSTTASLTAAALSEGLPAREACNDFGLWLEWLEGNTRPPGPLQGWVNRTRDLAQRLRRQVPRSSVAVLARPGRDQAPAFLLAAAYPDRIARRRHSGGYQLSNGRSARFAEACALEREKWLIVAVLSGTAGRSSDTIRCAVALDPALFEAQLGPLVRKVQRLGWDTDTGVFRAEHERRVGALLLTRDTLPQVPAEERQAGLVALLQADNLERLPWTPAAEAYRARAALMHALLPDWPAFDRDTLCATADDWLALFLAPVSRLGDLKKVDLVAALMSRLDYAQQKQLEAWLPERWPVPSGSRIRIDYTQSPPVLAVKLQEMFGAADTPTVAGGRIALQVHLLSPAGRPLQVTQDLSSFWRSVYPEVRKEMKGRYPKHPWPLDPLAASPTAHTKKRQSIGDAP
jgi:ATP-dependent helicase HrpB